MKAEELMIGDWVSYNGISNKISLADFGIDKGHTEWRNEIEPIPLTEEILEKNFPDPTDGLTWFQEEGGFNCHTYVPKCEINAFGLFKYVHQLQNALRLCGIDKSIEL